MGIDQLIFVGLGGWVSALDRDTGQLVWECSELHSGYTSLLLDGDRLIVSTNGYLFCLDALTGRVVWKNPLRGYGLGIAHLASVRGQNAPATLLQETAAKDRICLIDNLLQAAQADPHSKAPKRDLCK